MRRTRGGDLVLVTLAGTEARARREAALRRAVCYRVSWWRRVVLAVKSWWFI